VNSTSKDLVFVSYRRQDSSAAARWLAQTVSRTFGAQSVFVDTESIRMGDEWPARIDQALGFATILIAVIGERWLRIADDAGRRRLDKEDDWVRNEIAHALEQKLHVIPLLLAGTKLPKKNELPAPLERLTSRQAFDLRDDRWESDLALLLARLEELGLARDGARSIRYPTPRLTLQELSRDEISAALKQLPGWQMKETDIPGKEALKKGVELTRVYEFASFEDAIAFMGEAARHVSEVDHHPRWENIWRNVSIWLTTWDIGHRPSQLDIELADFLERLREKYPPARPRRTAGQPRL